MKRGNFEVGAYVHKLGLPTASCSLRCLPETSAFDKREGTWKEVFSLGHSSFSRDGNLSLLAAS